MDVPAEPEDGVFALEGNEGLKVQFNSSVIRGEGGELAAVLAPGICNAPNWYGHGSLFIYKHETD